MSIVPHLAGKSTSFIDRARTQRRRRPQLQHAKTFSVMSTRRAQRARSGRVAPLPMASDRKQVPAEVALYACMQVTSRIVRAQAFKDLSIDTNAEPSSPRSIRSARSGRSARNSRAGRASPGSARSRASGRAAGMLSSRSLARNALRRQKSSAATTPMSNWRHASTVVTAANKFKQAGEQRRQRVAGNKEKRRRIFAEKVRGRLGSWRAAQCGS